MRHLYVTLIALVFSCSLPKAYGQIVGPILGNHAMCAGLTTSLSDTTAGGTWSTSSTSIATVGSSTGIVTGINTGTDIVTYTVGGNFSTLVVTVNPNPAAITGLTGICPGECTTLNDATVGGIWSTGTVVVATIGSTGGIACAVATGTTIVTYTVGTGCIATTVITVNPSPGAILGVLNVCVGLTTDLTDLTGGGTWSSTAPVVGTVGGTTGVVTGLNPGTTTISYILGTGCYATAIVSVDPAASVGLGSPTLCVGGTDTLEGSVGGTWSTSNPLVATYGLPAHITGVSAGTSYITYTLPTGCFAFTIVTVNTTASPILGGTGLCMGGTTSLSDAIGGGTWSSSDLAVGSVGSSSGVVLGIVNGTTVISYEISAGCIATTEVTVGVASPILGSTGLCVSGTTSLSDATGGGTWSSSNTTIGGVGSSSGVVNGNGVGTCEITYTASSGCMASVVVTVNGSVAGVSGPSNLCIGVGYGFSDATSGGMWSSSNTDVTIGSLTGIIVGVTAGTVYISYSLGSGCTSTMLVTVNASPGAIGGSTQVCEGTMITLTDGTVGGTWISSSTPIATINSSTGLVTGISAGSVTMTYELSTGCMATMGMTVNPAPSPVSGSSTVCVGGTDTLSGFTGGTWSGGGGAATISTGGVITGVTVGSATFTYTATTGCDITFSVTVTATVASISGPGDVCVGSSITLTDATSGGTWSTAGITATVGSTTGVVTGNSAGIATISYSISGGCYSTTTVTVNTAPAGITGATYVCAGSSTTLNDATSGGTWSSSATGIATIGTSTGVVNGIAGGITDITYELGTGCFTFVVFTVDLPTLSVATSTACGGSDTLTATTSSTSICSWSPATGLSCSACDTTIANVSATTTYTVSVMDSFGCVSTTTVNVDGNRISGFITMTVTPTDTVKVWLVQFNSADSVITAEDSIYSCMDGGTPYYEFDNEPAGTYMVKAMLLGGLPGTSGYIPTYGLSTAHWDTATNIVHVSATDTQHINMIYGTVPTGPGFIGGLVSSGAGRGTASGVPVPGMLVYLEDGAGNILTYTYTNSSGLYSFSGLAYGSYRIYPEAYRYYTTPWISISLSASTDSVTSADFYQNTTLHIITPGNDLHTTQIVPATKISVYPNPAINELNVSWENEQTGKATAIITDITGRAVYKSAIEMTTASGIAQLDIQGIVSGIYFIMIKSDSITYTGKILIQQ